jgi:hypothetical protein
MTPSDTHFEPTAVSSRVAIVDVWFWVHRRVALSPSPIRSCGDAVAHLQL